MIKKLLALVVVPLAIVAFFVLNTEKEFDLETLRGKNVLITGASSGIGEQMAYIYAKNGANVYITARREALLQTVVKNCEKLGSTTSKFGYVTADMSKGEGRKRVVEKAVEFLGDLDQLILNHAVVPQPHVWTGSEDQINNLQLVMDANFMGFAQITALALPSLTKTQGSIGVVSSDSGRLPFPYYLNYCASKFAIDGFFSGLRMEFRANQQNVSVSVVSLGAIETKTGRSTFTAFDDLLKEPENSPLRAMDVADPKDAAFAIIRATSLRIGDVIFPTNQFLWPQMVIRALAPEFMDRWASEVQAKG